MHALRFAKAAPAPTRSMTKEEETAAAIIGVIMAAAVIIFFVFVGLEIYTQTDRPANQPKEWNTNHDTR